MDTSIRPESMPPYWMWERDTLKSILKSAVRMRQSPRLECSVDIVFDFSLFGEFSRTEIQASLRDNYHEKVIDEAIADLEASGVLVCTVEQKPYQAAGAIYALTHHDVWHRRQPKIYLARAQRRGK